MLELNSFEPKCRQACLALLSCAKHALYLEPKKNIDLLLRLVNTQDDAMLYNLFVKFFFKNEPVLLNFYLGYCTSTE